MDEFEMEILEKVLDYIEELKDKATKIEEYDALHKVRDFILGEKKRLDRMLREEEREVAQDRILEMQEREDFANDDMIENTWNED